MESEPFAGVVLCCTSIPVDLRTDLAKKVTELGGVHKNDLTHEVTHLVVGDYNTPKYRHVAYERPDIKPMCVGWVDAVLALWTRDAPIDRAALEDAWRLRTFEVHGGLPGGPDSEPVERGKLLISVTGFEEDDRQAVIATILDNGGVYSGDLTRNVTHLIVNKPEGKKYAAAMHWNVKAVSIEWLRDCAARGMILDEAKYDPRLPPDERGKGAWVRTAAERAAILGKRLRDAAAGAEKQGQRKLRKTASKKLSVQRDDLWGHILGKPSAEAAAPAPAEQPEQPNEAEAADKAAEPKQQAAQPQPRAPKPPPPPPTADTGGVLASSVFCIHGFTPARTEVLANAVATMGGAVASSLDEMAARAAGRPESPLRQHVLVPQNEPPDAHPSVAASVVLVTEFFIEKCLHKKQYPPDGGAGVIGRPFPVFPIPGFDALSVCTSGFTGVDLNQIDKTVRQLGAAYAERFTAQCSVLVVTALAAVRKQKLELALAWKVPVVDAAWLWACIASGNRVPVDAYLFPQLRQNPSSLSGPAAPHAAEPSMALTVPTLVVASPRTLLTAAAARPPAAEEADKEDESKARGVGDEDDTDWDPTAPYETAPTHPVTAEEQAPIRENPRPVRAAAAATTTTDVSKNNHKSSAVQPLQRSLPSNLNRSASPPKGDQTPQPPLPPQPPQPRKPLGRVVSEVADSAAGDSDDPIESEGDGDGDGSRRGHKRDDAVSPVKQRPPQTTATAAAGAAMKRSSTTTAAATTSASTRARPPRAAISRVVSDGLHHPHVPIGISIGDLMKDGGGTTTTRLPPHQQTQHQQHHHHSFGRSHSSVSGMSVPEGDGAAVAGASANEAAAGADASADDDPSALPPPTQVQVQYLDPEAERIRAQLMRKILGGAADPSSDGGGGGGGSKGVGAVVDAAPPPALGTAEEALAEMGRPIRRSSRRLR